MLNDPTTVLRGVGPKKALILKEEAGIETIEDLLYYAPRRYVDRSHFKLIKDCFVNELVTISGTISDVRVVRRRKRMLEVVIDDGTDTCTGVFFGGIDYFLKLFTTGDTVIFSGKINFFRVKQITHPEFDFIENADDATHRAINTGRIIPLYRSTEKLKGYGLDSRGFRRIIKPALETYAHQVIETLPEEFLAAHSLPGLRESLYAIHFPDSFDHAERARKRLAFNEIFFHQYYLAISRRFIRETSNRPAAEINTDLFHELAASLPFKLTEDQKTAIEEIRRDMSSPFPMNRLLQGDVGSGKTVVAMAAALFANGLGVQTAIMAPTELLAQQHFNTFQRLIGNRLRTVLLIGGLSSADRRKAYDAIASGGADLVIGTHAIIQEEVRFKKLGLIVIDEQHRFGVEQRSALREKGDETDLLVMTATPIPRSLSLTLYGDLSVSSIRTMPADRIPVKTLAFPESRLSGVYNSIEKYISLGRQAYYVLPLVEDSDKLDLKSAIGVFEHLKNEIFINRRVELIHGRMKQPERDAIMERFKRGEIDILVSTTVIEVGIDVPNASIIVVEHAERFGLAQLHQLRGRVGRGSHQSFCILITPDDISDEARARIETIVSTTDGFIISEEDLRQRGAGELIGVRQHGHGAEFEFADLSVDIDLILHAREFAEQSVARIDDITRLWREFRNRKYGPLLDGIRNKRILSILS
ncbi:MAG: ATP-dependent DNA helicase RecG [Spirochaetes bacterium]|nr:ATP-dependent DNA helicase RecG [Spirochaetota bacterium]